MPELTNPSEGLPPFDEADLQLLADRVLILQEYDILRNDENDLLFHIPFTMEGEAALAAFHYAGGEHGLLWKRDGDAVLCTSIHPEVRPLLDKQLVIYFCEGREPSTEEDDIHLAKIIRTPNVDSVLASLLRQFGDVPGRQRSKSDSAQADRLTRPDPVVRMAASENEDDDDCDHGSSSDDGDEADDLETSSDEDTPGPDAPGFRYGDLLRSDSRADTVETILGDCRRLAGCEPFKAYMEEWARMRPLLRPFRKNPEGPVEHLLFAIEPGCGCTTALKLLSRLMALDGPFGGKANAYGTDWQFGEQWLPDESAGVSDLDIETKTFADGLSDEAPGLLGLHMAHWLDKLHTPQFTRILEGCASLRHRIQFVFIIPFVDAGVLSRVHNRLSDQLNVRVIQFPPYTDTELIQVARERFGTYGYGWDGSAGDGFARLLRAERHDLRFYGVRTAQKLVTEILLWKLAHRAHSERLGGETISAADLPADPHASAGSGPSGFERLEALEGLQSIKRRLREMVGALQLERAAYERGEIAQTPCLHMLFTGPPGTGKTEVARILGQILREENLLPQGDLIEATRFDMVGQYIGQTGPKTIQLCRSAIGSILFIDEAYLLASGNGDGDNGDFGREALGALIAEMENNRDRLMVILAGYKEEMEQLFRMNPGLRDRVPHQLHFEPYDREVLARIAIRQLRSGQAVGDEAAELLARHFRALPGQLLLERDFGNARYVRNLTERIRMKAVLRRGRAVRPAPVAELPGTGHSAYSGQPASTVLEIQPIDVESALAELQAQSVGAGAPVRRFGF